MKKAKDKLVGCPSCKTFHMQNERVKPEHYSGDGWITVCPNCQAEGFISADRLRKDIAREL